MDEQGQGKRYTGEHVDVFFDARRCIHAAECVRGLPAVFDRSKRPWVEPNSGPPQEVAATVLRCPSGALHFAARDGTTAPETPALTNEVRVRLDGPLYVRGNVRIISQDGELVLHDTRIALCRCGQSKNKPFCDNSHVAVNFEDAGAVAAKKLIENDRQDELSIVLDDNGPLHLIGPFHLVSADGTVNIALDDRELCRCGGSGHKPFCDGTHKRIHFVSM